MDGHPSQKDFFAARGPKQGGRDTIVVGLQSSRVELPPHVRHSICDRIDGCLRTRADSIQDAPPRRGKKLSRRLVFLTVRLAKGVKPLPALKDVRRSIRRCLECLNPHLRRMKRLEREARRTKTRAQRRHTAQKLREGTYALSSFRAAFALT